MLSLIHAEEIKSAVIEYLKATYNFDNKKLEQAFTDFLYNIHLFKIYSDWLP